MADPGGPSTVSTAAPTASTSTSRAFVTSSAASWRSKEERDAALHRSSNNDGDVRARKWSRATSTIDDRKADRTQSHSGPTQSDRTSARHPSSSDDWQYRRGHPARPDRRVDADNRTRTSDVKTRQETRDKIKRSIAAAEKLPPLTDEDFHEIYQDLLTYDAAPPSPFQRRQLLLEQAHAAASRSALPIQSLQDLPLKQLYQLVIGRDGPALKRIEELRQVLETRTEALPTPTSEPVQPDSAFNGEASGHSLASTLARLRQPQREQTVTRNKSAAADVPKSQQAFPEQYSEHGAFREPFLPGSEGGHDAGDINEIGAPTTASQLPRSNPWDIFPDEIPVPAHTSGPIPQARHLDPMGITSSDIHAHVQQQATDGAAPSRRTSQDPSLSTSDGVQHAETRRQTLDMLGRLLPPTADGDGGKSVPSASTKGQQKQQNQEVTSVQIGLVTSQEWAALVLTAAADKNLGDLLATFELMHRASVDVSQELLATTVRLLSSKEQLVPLLLRYLQEKGMLVSAQVHHQVVVGMLAASETRDGVVQAEKYLRKLEEAESPALSKTYAAVIAAMFKMRKYPGLRERAWNLFAHMRLVAHPTPNVQAFNAMIQGCSLDADKVSPERALDLFTEMVELKIAPTYETYSSLIRTCAKARDEVFYFEALRLLKELLDRNSQPERDIFNSLLQGARSRGDLSRAKWIVNNMVNLAQAGSLALQPDHATMSNLFYTYATYAPPATPKIVAMVYEQTPTPADADIAPTPATSEDEGRQTGNSRESNSDSPSDVSLRTQATIESFEPSPQAATGEAVSSYVLSRNGSGIIDGESLFATPLPSSRTEIVRQVHAIMHAILTSQIKDTTILSLQDLRSRADSDATEQTDAISIESLLKKRRPISALVPELERVLSRIRLTPLLLNSYLTVLCAHSTMDAALNFFKTAFKALDVPYSPESWEAVFDQLNKPGKRREWKVKQARSLSRDWKEWLSHCSEKVEFRTASLSRHVEFIWSRHISIEARANDFDGAMDLLEEFRRRFPAQNIIAYAEASAQAQREGMSGEAAAPKYLINMASFLYPETSSEILLPQRNAQKNRLPPSKWARKKLFRHDPDVLAISQHVAEQMPPHLTLDKIYLLLHRLVELEDTRKNRVQAILKEYTRALRKAQEILAGAFKEVQEARAPRRLANAQGGLISL